MGTKHRAPNRSRWLKFVGICVLAAGMSLAAMLILPRAVIGNPCSYHKGEYLAGAQPGWFIRLFFWPADSMMHPEMNWLGWGLCVSIGLVAALLLTWTIRRISKDRKSSPTPRSVPAINQE